MTRTAIIAVDGHAKAPRAAYRDYVEKRYLDAFDDWLRAGEASGRPDAGNISPDLGPDAGNISPDLGPDAQILFDNAAEADGFDRDALEPHVERAGFELGVPSPAAS
jgi:hypothetical protein